MSDAGAVSLQGFIRVKYSDAFQASSAAPLPEDIIKTRMQTLSDLESNIAHRSRTVPRTLRLTFETPPETLADPAPQPMDGKFVAYYRWLEDQRRHVTEDLQPLGHNDADGKRQAMIRALEVEVRRLDRMKEREWCRYAVDVLVRPHLREHDVSGPMAVPLGIESVLLP